jgi:glycogen(starch) synthase
MKILMFGWEFPPHISGGLGTACHGLTNAMQAWSQHRLRFVLPRTVEKGLGVELICLAPEIAGSDNTAGPVSAYCASLLPAALAYAERVPKLTLLDEGVDVIHAHDWLTIPAALVAAEITGAPLVLHVHSTELDRCGLHAARDRAIVQIEQRGLDAAACIIAVSNYTRAGLIRCYGQRPDKVITVYNGITPVRAVTGVARGCIAFIGRITEQKGPRYFLEAAQRALQVQPSLQFVMAGEGDLRVAMQLLARELGIENNVTFPGFLSRDEIAYVLERSLAYVMPSLSEPFGIGALEAIALGAPVILARTAGVGEVVRHAIKVEPTDSCGIAEAMLRLAGDPAFAARMAHGARRDIRNLTWERAAASVIGVYEALGDRVATEHHCDIAPCEPNIPVF